MYVCHEQISRAHDCSHTIFINRNSVLEFGYIVSNLYHSLETFAYTQYDMADEEYDPPVEVQDLPAGMSLFIYLRCRCVVGTARRRVGPKRV